MMIDSLDSKERSFAYPVGIIIINELFLEKRGKISCNQMLDNTITKGDNNDFSQDWILHNISSRASDLVCSSDNICVQVLHVCIEMFHPLLHFSSFFLSGGRALPRIDEIVIAQ